MDKVRLLIPEQHEEGSKLTFPELQGIHTVRTVRNSPSSRNKP